MCLAWGFLLLMTLWLGLHDARTLLLPDRGVAMVGIISVGIRGFETFFLSFFSIFLLLGVSFFIKKIYRLLFDVEGLGWGDVKFFGVAGLWVPVEDVACFLTSSGVLGTAGGILWKRLGQGTRFPLGTVIAGLMIVWICIEGWGRR
jgi:prepilin signal peptidase PulO-like enzyme (type II secretory pathway)